ncbi:MAG: hypothetical protein AAFU56_07905 [Pseudomonadota bacterium]
MMALFSRTLTALTVMMSTMGAQPALGSNFIVLNEKPAGKLVSIGKVPPKRKKVLDLGPLRTKEAVLPGGVRTLEDRMRMRVNRALQRKQAVSNALRTTDEQ